MIKRVGRKEELRRHSTTKKSPRPSVEKMYNDFFRVNVQSSESDEQSLEQPSPLKVVESTTTYGVYEAPVR